MKTDTFPASNAGAGTRRRALTGLVATLALIATAFLLFASPPVRSLNAANPSVQTRPDGPAAARRASAGIPLRGSVSSIDHSAAARLAPESDAVGLSIAAYDH